MDTARPTAEEYIKASEERIRDWCNSTGVVLPVVVWVAICAELKTMFEAGQKDK